MLRQEENRAARSPRLGRGLEWLSEREGAPSRLPLRGTGADRLFHVARSDAARRGPGEPGGVEAASAPVKAPDMAAPEATGPEVTVPDRFTPESGSAAVLRLEQAVASLRGELERARSQRAAAEAKMVVSASAATTLQAERDEAALRVASLRGELAQARGEADQQRARAEAAYAAFRELREAIEGFVNVGGWRGLLLRLAGVRRS